MFPEQGIKDQKKKWPIFIIIIFVIGFLYILFYKDSLFINTRSVNLEVLTDGSIQVEEIWDINIRNTSTLFIAYPKEEGRYFKDVKVSYFENERWHSMSLTEYTASDGREPENYYHASNFNNKFEIAWGTGLAEGRDRKLYKIEYVKEMTFLGQNSVNKYNDTAELYHKFMGGGEEIPVKEFAATITFPEKVNKENALIWGHGARTGSIHFIDGNIEVKAKDVDPTSMVEARVLFPEEMLSTARRNQFKNGYDDIVREEGINTAGTVKASGFAFGEKYSKIIYLTVYVVVYVVIIVLLYNLKKKADEFSFENVKEWDLYTGVPKTKLNFITASAIYKFKSTNIFINTIIMKLSLHKILNLTKLEEIDISKKEKNQSKQNELFIDALKLYEPNLDSSIVREVINDRQENDLKLISRKAGVVKGKFNELVYIVDLKKYREKEVEEDEKLVLDFLISSIIKAYVKDTSITRENYTIKYINNLRKSGIKLTDSDWTTIESEFKNLIINNLDELYIEQYQLLLNIYYYLDKFKTKYGKRIIEEKEILEKQGIKSKEKEKIFSNLNMVKLIFYILAALGVVVALNVFGTINFNKEIYISLLFATLSLQVIVSFLARKTEDKVYPSYTEEGLNIYYEFKGLEKFLSDSSYISEYDEKSVIIWGEFLVFATFFGTAKKVLEALKVSHPEVINELETSPTYSSMGSAIHSYSSFSSSISTVSTFSASTGGTSSGGGGGFSSGGGGRRWRRPEVVEDKK